MNPAISEAVTYNLRNSDVKRWPFPHFFARNVFPDHFYEEILQHMEQKTDFTDKGEHGTYANRTFATNVDIPGLDFMLEQEFLRNVCHIFDIELSQRFPDGKANISMDLRLVRDGKDYKIGPHTDARWKLISLLFYLPRDYSKEAYGTSLYIPKDRAGVCEGGPHYPFEPFDKVWTAPFIPNSCLGFWKTNKSFHGVEPIPVQFNRDVLLYNVYAK